MPSVGTASLELVVDKQQLGQSITDSIDKVKKPVTDKMISFGKTMTKAATLPIVAGFGFAVKAASDLSESQNKVNVVFGKSADIIHDFSKTSAKDLGQSRRQAEEAAGTFGNLFVSMKIGQGVAADMSVKLVTLASDLASFNNVSPEDALEALRSGLVGETEPLRKFGVNLNDAAIRAEAMKLGLIASVKDGLTPAVKAQAAYSIILSQTSTAQGDFERTSGGLANQSRILKAELEDTAASMGTKLIPVALKLADVANAVLTSFSNLPAPLQNLALVGAGIVAAVGPVSVIVGNATKAVQFLAGALSLLAAHPVFLALAALTAGAALLGVEWFRSGQKIAQISAQLNSDFAPAVNNAALATKTQGEVQKNAAVQAYIHSKNLQDASEAQRRMAEQLPVATKTMEDLASASGLTNERVIQLANSMGINLATATQEEKDKLSAAANELARAITPTERLDAVTETLGNTAASTAEQFDAFKEALDAALGVQLTADQATIRYHESIAALATAVTENGTQVGFATEKQRNLGSALIDVVGDAQAEVDALARSGRISSDAATMKQALIDRLNALKGTFPQLAGPIDTYIGNINAIPDSASTTVTTPGLSSAIADMQLYRALFANVPAKYAYAPTYPKFGGGKAVGGDTLANHSYLVGEHGPELWMERRPGTIIPNNALTHMRALSASWGSDGANAVALTADVTLSIDGDTLARKQVTATANAGRNRRRAMT